MQESVIIARKKNKGRFFCFAVFGKGLSAEVGSIFFSTVEPFCIQRSSTTTNNIIVLLLIFQDISIKLTMLDFKLVTNQKTSPC